MKKFIIPIIAIAAAAWAVIGSDMQKIKSQAESQRLEIEDLKVRVRYCQEQETELLEEKAKLEGENLRLQARIAELTRPPAPRETSTPKRTTATVATTKKDEKKNPISVVDSERFNSILAKRYSELP